MNSIPEPTAPWDQIVQYYLDLRHQLGFQLRAEGQQLMAFAHYAHTTGHTGPLTTVLMVRWAQSSAQAGPPQQSRRLEIVRRFAQFWASFDPATEVPPAGLLGPSASVRCAYIYSAEQIAALLQAARQLPGPPAWRALTFETLLGLLVCTGLRISEALHLQRHDLDHAQAQLTLRHTKGGQTRCLVLHASVLAALQRYDQQRPATRPQDPFFSLESGQALAYHTVEEVFDQLRRRLGWASPGPRLHDLRHTFAVNCVQRWYAQGVAVDQKLLALSTYLGHANPHHTYWYLSAVPSLMTLVQARWHSTPFHAEPGVCHA